MKIIVIGGGAAGFFGALTCTEFNPNAEVLILEKSNKLLSKVKVSGGGRCNVTNGETEVNRFIKNYPRGNKQLKRILHLFSSTDTIQWFEGKGVKLKKEPDGRIFPVTDNSQTIIDALMKQAAAYKIKIELSAKVESIIKKESDFQVITNSKTFTANKVLVATGGYPNPAAYQWLSNLGHTIISPVPSLFTLNIPVFKLEGLQGLVVADASIKVQGSTNKQRGPILITHWGLSGPAVLKMSAWEARNLHEQNYNFSIIINWLPEFNEETLREKLLLLKERSLKKTSKSYTDFNLPGRLWERFLQIATINPEKKWADVSQKSINKLVQEITSGSFEIKGKTTFKEEFVTCGGVALNDINTETLESKKITGLYFAGEILDIDGITGGFNFQAAWSTGYLAGKNMGK